MEEAEAKAANLAWWEQAARVHAASDHYDLEGFAAGGDRLRPFELDEVGPVEGLDLVHLQCHVGTDTLSWARHGAAWSASTSRPPPWRWRANSPTAAGSAPSSSARTSSSPRRHWVDGRSTSSTPGSARSTGCPTSRPGRQWSPSCLRPRGCVYLLEIHPQVFSVSEDGKTIADDSIDAPLVVERTQGTYAVPDATLEAPVTVERAHPLSEVVSALLDVGLVIELLHEQAFTTAPWPWLERGDDGLYRFKKGFPRYPLTYSLRARKAS